MKYILIVVAILFFGCDQDNAPIQYTPSEQLEQQQILIEQLSISLEDYKARVALLESTLDLTYFEAHTQTSIMEVWIGEGKKESSIKIVNTPAHYSNQEVKPKEKLFKATTYYYYEYEKGEGAKKNVHTSWSYFTEEGKWTSIDEFYLNYHDIPESIIKQIEQ